jgi:hypothetical protein
MSKDVYRVKFKYDSAVCGIGGISFASLEAAVDWVASIKPNGRIKILELIKEGDTGGVELQKEYEELLHSRYKEYFETAERNKQLDDKIAIARNSIIKDLNIANNLKSRVNSLEKSVKELNGTVDELRCIIKNQLNQEDKSSNINTYVTYFTEF